MVKVKAPSYQVEVLADTQTALEFGCAKRAGYLVVNGATVFGHKYQGHCTYGGKDRVVIDTDSRERAIKAVQEAWVAALKKPTNLSEMGF